jgi:hypothetical protein
MEADADKHEISFHSIVLLSLAWRGDTIDGMAHPLVYCPFPIGPCVFVNTIETTCETVNVLPKMPLYVLPCRSWYITYVGGHD